MKPSIKYILILLLGTSFFLPSQGKTKWYKITREYTILDTVLLKVNYLKTYKEYVGDIVLKKNICELRIGEEVNSFCGNTHGFYMDHAPAEVREKAKDFVSLFRYAYSQSRNYDEEKNYTEYFKNHPEKGILTQRSMISVGDNSFYGYEEPVPEHDWQLEDGDSIVCGYPCGKATTTFHGRTWHVWYTLGIPYSDGPWKLGGLLGLILKATDSTGEFDFTAITIEEEHSKMEDKNKVILLKSTMTKVTPQRFEELSTLYMYDIIAFHQKRDGMEHARQVAELHERLGYPLKPERRTPCLIEYYGKGKE